MRVFGCLGDGGKVLVLCMYVEGRKCLGGGVSEGFCLGEDVLVPVWAVEQVCRQ